MQVTLCVESKFMDNVEGCLDATAPEKIHYFRF